MERRGETLRCQVEHRRVSKLLNFLPYVSHYLVDIESALRHSLTELK